MDLLVNAHDATPPQMGLLLLLLVLLLRVLLLVQYLSP